MSGGLLLRKCILGKVSIVNSDITCGGLDTGNEKVIYIASEVLGQEMDMLKEGEYPE